MENKVKIYTRKFKPYYITLRCSNKWLQVGVYYKVRVKPDCIILEKVYTLDLPKGSYLCIKYREQCQLFLKAEINSGTYDIDLEDSDEDQIVILL